MFFLFLSTLTLAWHHLECRKGLLALFWKAVMPFVWHPHSNFIVELPSPASGVDHTHEMVYPCESF